MTISFDDDLNRQLQNPEFQKEWLRQTILDYIENGDYIEFFRALEQVIKARTTVTDFAQQVGINRVQLVDILHGRTKTPSLITIGKILSGLGYTLDVKSA
ncbi:helix-turn-helix domain-containing protein [bacterium]|nr:helix-turn-helix domain-containing protein [bacterium]